MNYLFVLEARMYRDCLSAESSRKRRSRRMRAMPPPRRLPVPRCGASAPLPPSALEEDGVAVDPHRKGRDIDRHRAVDKLAGPHIELREMQRALDDVAVELAARQRRVAVPADVAKGVEP